MIKLFRLFWQLLSLSGNAKFIFTCFVLLSVTVAFSEIVLISLVAEFLADRAKDSNLSLILSRMPAFISEGYIVIFVAILALILKLFLIRWTARITFNTGALLMAYVYEVLINQKLNYFGKNDKSRHIAFLASKVDVVIHTLVLPNLNLASGGIISIIFLIFISYTSPALAFIASIIGLMAYGIPILISTNIFNRVAKILSLDVSEQVHYIKTGFQGLRDIKIWNIEDHFVENIKNKSLNIAKARRTSFIWSLVPRSLIEAAIFIVIGIFLLNSSNFTSSGDEIFIYVTFFLALLKVLPSFQQVYYSWQNLRAGLAVSSELDEYFNISKVIKKDLPKYDDPFKSIELQNIDFSYIKGKKILNDFSLVVEKGEKIAIYGESGSGKSTLLDLIANIHQPQAGKIFINNQLIEQGSLNPFVAYISQDPFLFDMSIKDNVTLSFANNIPINHERLNDALIKSGVQQFMDSNKYKLDYIVGEGGSALSGGQAQRIAIARALYSDKQILLLDEASSALDSSTRDFIINGLLNLDITIILITHDYDVYNIFPKKINFKTKLYEN